MISYYVNDISCHVSQQLSECNLWKQFLEGTVLIFFLYFPNWRLSENEIKSKILIEHIIASAIKKHEGENNNLIYVMYQNRRANASFENYF